MRALGLFCHAVGSFSIAGVAGLYLGLAALAPAAAGELERVFSAKYRVQAFGLPLGRAKLTVRLNGEAYLVEASAETTGISQLFAGEGSGDVNATGVLVDGVVRPATFSQKLKEDGKKSTVKLVFGDDRVAEVLIDPKPRKRPSRKQVPVTDAHKRGVVDPVSALLSAMADAKSDSAVCARTVPVFTGESRFDLHLFHKGRSNYRGGKGSYDGAAIVCGVEYVPVSGHKPDSKDVTFNTENRDNEVWFARIGDIDVLVPVLWRLKFRDGRVDIAMSDLDLPKSGRSD